MRGAPTVPQVGRHGRRPTGRKGIALRWNEEPSKPETTPRRSGSPGLPTEEMRQMAAAAAELRRRTPSRPASRPRPVSTGQVPVARTRAVSAGPTGIEQLPVARPVPPAPPADPSLRRLRAAPPVEVRPAALAVAPVVDLGAAEPQPRTLPLPVLPSTIAPASRPVVRTPPPSVEPDVEPLTRRRRRPLRCLVAVAAAIGLLAIHALPSIAAAEVPPVEGIHQDDDLQQFHVGTVDASGATMDGVSGDMPVVAPTWVVPLKGELRDGFGPRLAQPVAGVNLFHRGQDIGGGCGAAIHAAASGRVVSAGWWGTYGNWTLIDHGGGIETGYAHQARMLVHAGQSVRVGQVIGYEGTTGASTGCHLHLEVHINGVAVNPVPFFKAKGIPLGL